MPNYATPGLWRAPRGNTRALGLLLLAACSSGAQTASEPPPFVCPTSCELRRPQIVCTKPGENLCVCLHDLAPVPTGCEETEGLEDAWPYHPGYCCTR
jgi:hypothetical protein